MLPGGREILFTIDDYCCDYADGRQLYELLTKDLIGYIEKGQKPPVRPVSPSEKR